MSSKELPSWHREGVNYWDNQNCPREYLVNALVNLIDFVEGESAEAADFKDKSMSWLRDRVEFYEYVADK